MPFVDFQLVSLNSSIKDRYYDIET